MEELIRAKPMNWQELLEHFASQPYPAVYRAFGQLRPKLGRVADQRPDYPYTFFDQGDFVDAQGKPAKE